MQRASVSRRSEATTTTTNTMMSPGGLMRSRSSERHLDVACTNTMDSDNNNYDHHHHDGHNTDTTTTTPKNSSNGSSNNNYQRSMSDPFDTATMDDSFCDDNDNHDGDDNNNKSSNDNDTIDTDDNDIYALAAATTNQMNLHGNNDTNTNTTATTTTTTVIQIMPTFARYPCIESKNYNCYSVPPISIFHVRGSNYMIDSKKITSQPYILESRGSDLFLIDPKKTNFTIQTMTQSILGGQLYKLPTLAILFRFPWGYMNLYFEIPKKFIIYMNDDNSRSSNNNNNNTATVEPTIDPTFTISEQLFAKWLLGDTKYKNERLKLIPYVAEGPWVVRNMVTGRPAIIGKKLPVSYQYTPPSSTSSTKGNHNSNHTTTTAPLLTVTLDIGNGSATAKRIVSVCRRYMSSLTVDIGFVIQGESTTELPEQMLGAMRVHGPDPLKAPKLN